MSEELRPKYGQIVVSPIALIRKYQRRGCGSSPDKCGFSHRSLLILSGRLARCVLSDESLQPATCVTNEHTGSKSKEYVKTIYCASDELVVTRFSVPEDT